MISEKCFVFYRFMIERFLTIALAEWKNSSTELSTGNVENCLSFYFHRVSATYGYYELNNRRKSGPDQRCRN